MTAAELRAIGERVAQEKPDGWKDAMQAYRDRARLYSALERLIDHCVMEVANRWCITAMPGDLIWFDTKDGAIDALLGGGV